MPLPLHSHLPPDDPQRRVLHDEVHARPPVPLVAPERIAHLALRIDAADVGAEKRQIDRLAGLMGCAAPAPDASYAFLDGGALRVKWERHTEYTSLTFFCREVRQDGDALEAIPAEWLEALPGRTLYAASLDLRPATEDEIAPAAAEFHEGGVVGAQLGDGVATVFTDFRIRPDGFARFVLLDHGMSSRQAGRFVQRLFEIETYRMMALLAFPLAREVGAALTDAEARLALITERAVDAVHADDASLLEDLTRLAAEIERSEARSRFRFGAGHAYYQLVRQRVGELREWRVQGVQTIAEFIDRRLAPAMATCESAARRQAELSGRIARTSQLLRTRVDVALEQQNQALLESMNRRAKVQLRLQQTVEGLSIAAITYYAAGLVGYVAKAGKAAGLHIEPDIVIAIAIPVVAAVLYAMSRQLHHRLKAD